jgi:hypothetical protein
MLEIGVLSAICMAIGLLIGYEIGAHKKTDAPAPVLPDYDVNSPINARGRRGEKVMICGSEFTRMN